MHTSKESTIIKGVAVLLFSVFGVFLLFSLISGMDTGFKGGYMQIGTGITLTAILLLLAKLLFILFVVGLVAGVVIWGKSFFTEKDIESIKSSFSLKKTWVKETCSECNKQLNTGWKLCPYCGQAKETKYDESEA